MSTGTQALNWSLHQYSIGGLIASGHFGTVYQARHLPTGRDVALKLIPLHGPDSDEKVAAERHGAVLQQRFAAAHARLVPEVFEHQPIAPFYAIAMELVQGRQLTSVIADGPVPSRQAAEIALAIARFLEKAHRFETEIEGQRYALIVHADLKPDHVLLVGNGIRVLDFGIAKALSARTLVTTNKWGSVQYASPERLQSDGQVNEHADFWSLGVMLFEMLAGFRPYRRYEHNASLLDNAIRKQDVRESLPPHIEPVLVAIVQKLLAPQYERRYQQASAIVRDLEAFLNGQPTSAGLEYAQASQETTRLAPRGATVTHDAGEALPHTTGAPRPSSTVPTEPLAGRSQTPVVSAAAAPPVAAPATPTQVRGRARRAVLLFTRMTRGARAAAIVALLCVVASEGVSLIRGQRLRARIPALEVSDLARVRLEYDRIGRWTLIGVGRWQVAGPLAVRLTQMADQPIEDYRHARAAVAQAQWERARESLEFAFSLEPGNMAIASRRAYVRGQIARIGRRHPEAIRLFNDAARLDPRSVDPYLGLAAVYAYGTRNLEGLTTAVANAERLGFRSGARERAEFGDLHLALAEDARTSARGLTGVERIAPLERAIAAYTKCIEYFDGLTLGDSQQNLRTCQRRLTEMQAQLPPAAPAAALSGNEL